VKSIGAMVKQISGLAGTEDVSDWEEEFIYSVIDRTKNGDDTRSLTEKQAAVVHRIYTKHFGDA